MIALHEGLDTYFAAVSAVDAAQASEIVLDMLDAGTAAERITTEILAPAQIRVGQLWEQGDWSVADEHAATAVTETALSALYAAAARRRRGGGHHVVVVCAEGEWHTLPARMAAMAGTTSDSRITVLGPSMPADHLGRRLSAGDVDLLALSCTLPPNLLGAAACIQAAHEAGVPVLAGGRAFGTSGKRAHAIGADAWADNAAALLKSPPVLAQRDTAVPTEALLLDAVDDGTVAMAYERLVAAFPRLASMTPFQQARTREDLRWMARFTGAAVLTDDVGILDEFLAWLCGLLRGRVPVAVIATSAHVVADTIEPFATTGAQLLRDATQRLPQDQSP